MKPEGGHREVVAQKRELFHFDVCAIYKDIYSPTMKSTLAGAKWLHPEKPVPHKGTILISSSEAQYFSSIVYSQNSKLPEALKQNE